MRPCLKQYLSRKIDGVEEGKESQESYRAVVEGWKLLPRQKCWSGSGTAYPCKRKLDLLITCGHSFMTAYVL